MKEKRGMFTPRPSDFILQLRGGEPERSWEGGAGSGKGREEVIKGRVG